MKNTNLVTVTVTVAAAALALALVTDARAGEMSEQRKPASANGTVSIENPGGSTRVIGWDRNEILVRGKLGAGAEGVEFSVSGATASIEVEAAFNPMGAKADLEISVPSGSALSIESFQGAITVTDVKGTISAETVNGSIEVAGGAREVDLHAVNGQIHVGPGVPRIKAEAVNGGVFIREAASDVEASTVNGTLSVTGKRLERVDLETVAGALHLEAALSKTATVRISSVSGAVDVTLPASTGVVLSASTFSGSIDNALSEDKAEKGRWNPTRRLEATVGAGGARVTVETLSGSISFLKGN